MKVRKISKGVPHHSMYEDKLVDGKTILVPYQCVDSRNGLVQALPVDQFSGKSFLLNECGFPMNDIMIFEQAQSDSIARAALSRIKQVNTGNPNDGLTLEQRFQRIVPANWSSPAEYVRASQTLARMNIAEVADRQRAAALAQMERDAAAAAAAPAAAPAAPSVQTE